MQNLKDFFADPPLTPSVFAYPPAPLDAIFIQYWHGPP